MATRDYRSETLTVHWNSDRCIHSGNCVQALRAVFDPKRRPWIMVENAHDEEIARAVELCPSGALGYTMNSAPDAPPPPPATTSVVVNEDGPLEVYGEIEVINADGQPVRRAQHLFLCRCGNSRNKPYCDGSHRRVRFTDPGMQEPTTDQHPPPVVTSLRSRPNGAMEQPPSEAAGAPHLDSREPVSGWRAALEAPLDGPR